VVPEHRVRRFDGPAQGRNQDNSYVKIVGDRLLVETLKDALSRKERIDIFDGQFLRFDAPLMVLDISL
jgi:hypothetical protein